MIKKIFLLLLLFTYTYSQVGAQTTINGHTYANTVYISNTTTFPYTASVNNTAYVLTENLTTQQLATNGVIYFNDCDQCALVSNSTATYQIPLDSSTASSATVGIKITNCDDLIIRRIDLQSMWNYPDTFTNSPILLDIDGTGVSANLNITVDSSIFFTTGYSNSDDWARGLNAIRVRGTFKNINVNYNTIEVKGYGFLGRNYFPQIGVFMVPLGGCSDLLDSGYYDDYSLRLLHNTITSNWAGVMAYAQQGDDGVLVMDTNLCYTASVNTAALGAFGLVGGSYHGDGGGIAVYHLEKIFMRNNTMRPVIDMAATPLVYGGAGGYISNITQPTLPVSPHSQLIENDMYGRLDRNTDHAPGLFLKYNVNNIDAWGNKFTSATSGLGIYANGAWLSNMNNSHWHDNIYEAISYDDNVDANAIKFRGMNPTNGYGNVFENETLRSNDYFMQFWPDDNPTGWEGLIGVSWNAFRFERIDTVSNMSGNGAQYTCCSWVMYDDSLIDISVADPLIYDTTIAFLGGVSADEIMQWFRHLQINVVGGLTQGINGTVTLTNNYGVQIYNSSVGADGLDTSLVKYYQRNGTRSLDSLLYNPISYIVSYPGETNLTGSLSVGANDTTVTFTFPNVTDGDGWTNPDIPIKWDKKKWKIKW